MNTNFNKFNCGTEKDTIPTLVKSRDGVFLYSDFFLT